VSAILTSLVILFGGAAATALLARFQRIGLLIATSSIVVASVLCLVAALPCLAQGQIVPSMTLSWPMPLGTAKLAIDGLSAWFLVAIALLSSAVAIYAFAYVQADIGREPVPSLGTFLCMLVAALILVVTAADVALFLVGWELLMLASFFLVSYHHRRAEVRRAAWVYLVANHVGTALFVVPLFGILAAKVGTIDFQAFPHAFQGSDRGVVTALFLLGLFGFGTKAGFVPMHVWLPVAHPAAPTPVSAILSGVVIKAGIYGLLRLLSWLPPLPTSCAVVMLVFGMVSGVLGVLYALAQHDIKRLLAYHSVENIGIIGLGIGMGMLGQTLEQPALVALGYGGALLHVLNHALFKGLLFLSAGAVIHATGTGDIERLGGLARKTPVNAGLFLLAAVAICGLPPLNGFVSEWLVYGSLFTGAGVSSRLAAGVAAMGAVSLALMGGLALACFAKVFGVVFLGEPRDGTIQAHSTPLLMQIAMLIPAILCAAIGFLPGVFVPFTAGGVSAVSGLDAGAFARQVQSILSPVGQLSVLVTVLVAFVILLVLVRHVLRRRHCEVSAPSVVTWGCGFTRPSARMEYTASSFAWSLIQSFRSLLWTHREVAAPTGPFPAHSELESHTPDMAEHDVFSPLLQGVSRVFRMIRTVSWSGESTGKTRLVAPGGRVGPARAIGLSAVAALRQGRVHVYLAFLVLTLLAVFFVEALSLDHSATLPGPPAAGSIDGDQK
jgi:hydrogenase-4 component B